MPRIVLPEEHPLPYDERAGAEYKNDDSAGVRARQPTVVETPSGNFVDIQAPDPADILLTDIAHKLAQNNRWGGSSRYPVSVAQHGVFVSRRVEQLGGSTVDQLLGLHHDDHEAFLSDIPRPWKALLGPRYKLLVRKMDKAIWAALDLPAWTPEQKYLVKLADNFAMLLEAKLLMPSEGRQWITLKRGEGGMPQRIVTPPYWHGELYWDSARREYLNRHAGLTMRLRQEHT